MGAVQGPLGRILIRIFSPDSHVRPGVATIPFRITIITTPLKFLPLRIKRFSYGVALNTPAVQRTCTESQRPLSPQAGAVCHDSAVPQVTAIYGPQLRLSTFFVYTLVSAENANREKLGSPNRRPRRGREREREGETFFKKNPIS